MPSAEAHGNIQPLTKRFPHKRMRRRISRILKLAAGAACLLPPGTLRAGAETDAARAELRIRGHSIERLTLLEQAGFSQMRFDSPGETIRLPAGRYRVEEVELQNGFSMLPWRGRPDAWFDVSPEGPNELVVGAPLYPTATGERHGSFLQLDYELVDGAGRSYFQQGDGSVVVPPPPQFEVFKDGEPIGSGSFEYG